MIVLPKAAKWIADFRGTILLPILEGEHQDLKAKHRDTSSLRNPDAEVSAPPKAKHRNLLSYCHSDAEKGQFLYIEHRNKKYIAFSMLEIA